MDSEGQTEDCEHCDNPIGSHRVFCISRVTMNSIDVYGRETSIWTREIRRESQRDFVVVKMKVL